jgi:hypothetical protein
MPKNSRVTPDKPNGSLRIFSAALLGTALALGLAGCTYYQTAPGVYSTTPSPSKYDRAWGAVLGAMEEQGVRITSEDYAAGRVQGTRGGATVSANLRTQPDGSVRVELRSSGTSAGDPNLLDRISRSYDARMGR